MCFNRLFIKSILLLGLILGMVGCSKTPDPQDDIPLFDAFIAENIDKVSDDPYISSTVRPGDKMYDVILHAQHGRWDDDEDKRWLDLIEQGNTDAMVWYGRILTASLQHRKQGYDLIHQAMLEGNPYAALELSEGSESCRYYFGKNSAGNKLAEMVGMGTPNESGVCSEDNFALALKGFEKLANEGDLRAQYFLLKQKSWEKSMETRAEYIREIIRFAEAHYYQPLMDYVGTILTQKTRSAPLESETPELELLASNLLLIASNNNYIPAINKLIELKSENIDKNDPLFEKGIKLGSNKTISWKVLLFAGQSYKNNLSPTERYFYGMLYKRITGSRNVLNLKFKNGSLTEKEMENVAKRVAAESIYSSVYIDGFTDSGDWH
ncbi:sel1 repeat family protein [Vibrio parahaemolyticus]|nr:sel1 repeat family protein [Vibrio parahaemolyticus]ELB2144607.1 sel1 repeat family protein [Vibrio parahaemolyticus]ELB2239878.1 sel1 repeat family protein [Vibrio parahaemolyticus]